MIGDIAGVVPSIQVTNKPLSSVDEFGLLVAAEIARHGPDVAADFVRDLTTRQALTTLDALPVEYSAQAWSDAGRMVHQAGAVPRTKDLDGLAAYLDQVFRPRLMVAAALLASGREAAEQVARTIAAGVVKNAGRPGAALPVTTRLLDAALRRAGVSLRSLAEWPSLPPGLLSQADAIVSGLGSDAVPDGAAEAIKLLVADAIYDSGSQQAAVDFARVLAGRRPAPAPAADRLTPTDGDSPRDPVASEAPVPGEEDVSATTSPVGEAGRGSGRETPVPSAFFDEPRPAGQSLRPPTPPETRPRPENEPDTTPDTVAEGQAHHPNTVVGADGALWRSPSRSDGIFCVNVAVVWLEQPRPRT
jgi:hypothetical protein